MPDLQLPILGVLTAILVLMFAVVHPYASTQVGATFDTIVGLVVFAYGVYLDAFAAAPDERDTASS